MQYTLRRVIFGAGIVLLGGIMGFMSCAAISGEARPGGINPLIKLAMIVIASGMAVGCTVCGLYVFCTAFLASRPKVGATAEATARRFVNELLGGYITPSNPAAAFACLCRRKQEELGSAKELDSARRSFNKVLKQQYDTNSLWYEMDPPVAREREEVNGSESAHAHVHLTLKSAPTGGPGEETRWQPHRLTFECVREQGRWLISEFEGGPAQFIGKPFQTDFRNPGVRHDLRVAWAFIVIGAFCILLAGGTILMGGSFICYWPLFGIVGLGLFLTGLAKRARY